MRSHGVSPQCSALQVLGARETQIAAVCGESDGMPSDFSQRDSEVIERLRSAARARGKPSRAFDFGVFSFEPEAHRPLAEVTFFGRAKKVMKAKESNSLRSILDKSDLFSINLAHRCSLDAGPTARQLANPILASNAAKRESDRMLSRIGSTLRKIIEPS